MKCKQCHEENPEGVNFCNHCGAKIESEGKTCPNPDCGLNGLPEYALFCSKCGTKLSGGFTSFTETVNGVKFDMVAIKGGTFLMGSNDGDYEKPINQVNLSDFYISKCEVTQAQFRAIMGNNPGSIIRDHAPVVMVSWYDSQEFLIRLNMITDNIYRLPTEAEWEYAAGGGAENRTKWAGTNSESDLINYAWIECNSGSSPHPVALKRPNALGLYDMSGNVYEWCNDWFGLYSITPKINPTGPTTGSDRVFRGGSRFYKARQCRTTHRQSNPPDYRFAGLGFRLGLDSRYSKRYDDKNNRTS
jgi:formylglycine-generating enzyme required for sulfatase activity